MKHQKHLSKTLCIVCLVAALLCLIFAIYRAQVLQRQLDDTTTQLMQAESLVDSYSSALDSAYADLTMLESDYRLLQENNEALQRSNDELQGTNDTLHRALSAYDYEFNVCAPAPPCYLDVPLDEDLQDYIWSLCCDYDIEEDYVLIYAMIRHESNFDSDVISATNDYGLMQINKGNHYSLSKRLGITDFLDPYQNVHAGIYMIANLIHEYGTSDALMAYNMGEGGAAKLWQRGIHSTSYSRQVLDYYNQFIEDI